MNQAQTLEVTVPEGLGIFDRTARMHVDEHFAAFLNRELPILHAKRLRLDVLTHVLDHEIQHAPEGLVAEFGVYDGTSVNRIAERLGSETVYGFDSFEGLPEKWIGLRKGAFDLRGRMPPVRSNVQLVKGLFQDSLPRFMSDHFDQPFRLMHVDCDLYSSAKTVLETAKKSIRDGTIVIMDEAVNSKHLYMGEMRAFYEFVRDSGRRYEWIGFGGDTGMMFRMPGVGGALSAAVLKAGLSLMRKPSRLPLAVAARVF